jgi:hypothetical protein
MPTSVTDYILEKPAKCPRCLRDIRENVPLEIQSNGRSLFVADSGNFAIRRLSPVESATPYSIARSISVFAFEHDRAARSFTIIRTAAITLRPNYGALRAS